MSLFRYLPYWKHVREDLLNTLDSLDGTAFSFSAHPRIPAVGELVVELANLCAATVAWLKHPDAEAEQAPFDPKALRTCEERMGALNQAFAMLEEFSSGISREELTRQRPLPESASEYFSYYEAYWEMMRHEVATLGRIETHLMALAAEQAKAMSFQSTTRITRQLPNIPAGLLAAAADDPQMDFKATAPIKPKLGDIDKVGRDEAGEAQAAPQASEASAPPAVVPKAESDDSEDQPAVLDEVEDEDEDPLAKFAKSQTLDDEDEDLNRLMG